MKRVLAVLALGVVLAGCSLLPSADDPSTSVPFSQLTIDVGEGTTLAVLGADSSWQPTGNHDCADVMHRLVTSTGEYQVSLLRADCAGNPQALNGFHGYFMAPPAGVEVASATTPIGPARVFSNSYEECTNGCAFGTDEVALVAVGSRTLQAIAVARVGAVHTRDRAALIALLQGLGKA